MDSDTRERRLDSIRRTADRITDIARAYDRLRYVAEQDASGAFLDLAEAAGKMTESSLDSLATLLELMWRVDSRFDGKLVVVESTKPTKPWVRMERK